MHKLPLSMTLVLTLAALAVTPVLAADRDGDGLRDGFETRWGVTDPDKRDTDGDGVIDSAEDLDGDRLSNLGEQRFKTDPGNRDTDGDGTPDGREDKNHNGISNAREQDRRPLPKPLKPTLGKAKSDYPAARDACFAQLGVARPLRCVFGDPQSTISVAVFGDSHALMWAPAFIAAAKHEGWKLITYFKGGCPSGYVRSRGQVQLDGHRSCNRWRARVLRRLNAHPPDLIVLTNSDGYKLVDPKGRLIPTRERPKRWKRGLARMIAKLPTESSVLVLGDAPENKGNPIKCLAQHRNNMSACEARRQPPKKRPFEVVERAVAAAAGAEFRTLYGKACSYDPCPVVQGHVLMWRDAGHLSATMVKKLKPSMRALLKEVVQKVVASGNPSSATLVNYVPGPGGTLPLDITADPTDAPPSPSYNPITAEFVEPPA